MLEVKKAEYRERFRIWIEFNDGASGMVDLEDALWGPVFEPLKNPEFFKTFRVSETLHTLAWENDADFAPEFLKSRVRAV